MSSVIHVTNAQVQLTSKTGIKHDKCCLYQHSSRKFAREIEIEIEIEKTVTVSAEPTFSLKKRVN